MVVSNFCPIFYIFTRNIFLKYSMIPKLLHQIFFKLTKDLDDIHVFRDCQCITQQRLEQFGGYEYRLWSEEECNQLIRDHYPEFKQLWEDFTQPIMRIDFIRYIILYHYGGIYLDLDMYPLQDFECLLHQSEVFVRWNNDKRKLPYNAVMMSETHNPLFMEIANHSQESFYEKSSSLPKSWTGRLVFHSTGHYMLQRVLKPKKIIPHDILKVNSKEGIIITSDNPYFEDFNASVWYQD